MFISFEQDFLTNLGNMRPNGANTGPGQTNRVIKFKEVGARRKLSFIYKAHSDESTK